MLKVRENLRSLNNFISKNRDSQETKPKTIIKKKPESGKKKKKTRSITHDDVDEDGNRLYNLPMQMIPKKKKKRKSPRKTRDEHRPVSEEERKVMEEFGGDQGELYNEYLELLSEVKEHNEKLGTIKISDEKKDGERESRSLTPTLETPIAEERSKYKRSSDSHKTSISKEDSGKTAQKPIKYGKIAETAAKII